MSKPSYYQIRNQENGVEILLYEQIGKLSSGEGITAKRLSEDLRPFKGRPLNVRINSPGGNVFEGNTIYNIFKNHKGRVKVFIDGIAASIASVIAMSGDEIIIPQNGMIMIHNPYGLTIGDADAMRKQAAALDKVKSTIVGIYHGKTKLNHARLSEMMTAETWLTGDEAKENGFADTLSEPQEYEANFEMLEQFSNKPRTLSYEVKSMSTKQQLADNTLKAQPAQIEWKKNPQIRADFNDSFEAYLFYLEETPGIKFQTLTSSQANSTRIPFSKKREV